jgi:hypothetical protein
MLLRDEGFVFSTTCKSIRMLSKKTVDTSGTSCYIFPEVAAMRTRRLLDFSRGRNSVPYLQFPNSHGIISFADPHLLNPVTSYRYKNHRGRGAATNIQTCKCAICIPDGVAGPSNLTSRPIPLSPLSATLTKIPISVDSKRLTGKLSSLDATLTKNTGGGGYITQARTSFSPRLIPRGACRFRC